MADSKFRMALIKLKDYVVVVKGYMYTIQLCKLVYKEKNLNKIIPYVSGMATRRPCAAQSDNRKGLSSTVPPPRHKSTCT